MFSVFFSLSFWFYSFACAFCWPCNKQNIFECMCVVNVYGCMGIMQLTAYFDRWKKLRDLLVTPQNSKQKTKNEWTKRRREEERKTARPTNQLSFLYRLLCTYRYLDSAGVYVNVFVCVWFNNLLLDIFTRFFFSVPIPPAHLKIPPIFLFLRIDELPYKSLFPCIHILAFTGSRHISHWRR